MKGLIPSKSFAHYILEIANVVSHAFSRAKFAYDWMKKFVSGMMRMGLLKSSPNFQRLDMDIPALLFLSIR